jgi:ribose-phosphate pyrophosphokinase
VTGPYLILDEKLCNSWVYPGGEVGVRALARAPQLLARIQSSEDLMRLVMWLGATQDAAGRPGVERVLVPYLPYARQDRRAVEGDPNAIEVLARVLASTGVREWHALDVHSERSLAAFRSAGCTLVSQSPVEHLGRFLATLGGARDVWLISPDTGASHKVREYAQALAPRGVRGVIACEKVRNPHTGKLSGFRIPAPPELGAGATLVIADDICDGGGTFLGVADVVRSQYGAEVPLHLFTTHGIYSHGLDALLERFATLGSTDSFLHGLSHPRLITIPIFAEEPRA